MKSHIIATSHPARSAKPATAAMIGFRAFATFSQRPMKSPTKASAKVLSCISLMSAPAANALSEPVSTIAPIAGSDSKTSSAALALGGPPAPLQQPLGQPKAHRFVLRPHLEAHDLSA